MYNIGLSSEIYHLDPRDLITLTDSPAWSQDLALKDEVVILLGDEKKHQADSLLKGRQVVENAIGKMPMMNVQASMYLLIQAKEGTVETVKSELDQYATKYEEQWSTYLPEQYELVKNRKTGIVGNTVYLIIAENAETLEQEITK